jgi:hypothetical protein
VTRGPAGCGRSLTHRMRLMGTKARQFNLLDGANGSRRQLVRGRICSIIRDGKVVMKTRPLLSMIRRERALGERAVPRSKTGSPAGIHAKLWSAAACCRFPTGEPARGFSNAHPMSAPQVKFGRKPTASKLAGDKAAASCRTPELRTPVRTVAGGRLVATQYVMQGPGKPLRDRLAAHVFTGIQGDCRDDWPPAKAPNGIESGLASFN